MHLEEAKLGIVRVGAGRGFVIERRGRRLVITAAHCLPELPPAMSFSLLEERTYAKLLGDINAPPTIAAECLFVDPVADIAVLGEPDDQALPQASEAYGILTDACPTLPISDRIHDSALLLYLDGLWRPCTLRAFRNAFRVDATPSIQGGMSGSPILNTDGEAVGVVVTNEGPHPKLVDCLPAWLLR
jgi:hypothetical protein